MFYRYPRDSVQSLMLRTGYALLSGHLTANGTICKRKSQPNPVGFLFQISGRSLRSVKYR